MNISFSAASPTQQEADVLAVACGTDLQASLGSLDAALGGTLLPVLRSRQFTGKAGTTSTLATLGRLPARELVVIGIGAGGSAEIKKAAGHAGRQARASGATSLALSLPIAQSDLATAIEHVIAGNYEYDAFKRESDRRPVLESLTVLGSDADEQGVAAEAQIRAAAQEWARELVNRPAADLYPETLADEARKLAALDHVDVEVWDFERCRREHCVGIVAVSQGSARPGCMVRVSYRPPGATAHIGLVGKGVTFDSGGLSIKPGSGMQTMRCDMGGAATMLAATRAVAELGVPVAVDCFIGAVENMVGSNSYKLGDILTYRNGVTVEIHNTDAEGRLVLADCLIRACKVEGVTHLIDAATLTGACVVAVGHDFAGLFTDDDAFAGDLQAAAAAAGEGLWRLPLHAPYKASLKSDFAELKNVGGREAGATTAALFLQAFVTDEVRWAHLDIAGPAFLDKASGFYAPGGTGQMVRTLTHWISSLG